MYIKKMDVKMYLKNGRQKWASKMYVKNVRQKWTLFTYFNEHRTPWLKTNNQWTLKMDANNVHM